MNMTSEEIKNKALAYAWEPWLERPFGAFILSLMARGTRRAIIKKYLGVDMGWGAFVFERGKWYISHKVEQAAGAQFVEDLGNQGFAENAGFRAEACVYDTHDTNAWDVQLTYNGETYVVTPKELYGIMEEGDALKDELKKLEKSTQ